MDLQFFWLDTPIVFDDPIWKTLLMSSKDRIECLGFVATPSKQLFSIWPHNGWARPTEKRHKFLWVITAAGGLLRDSLAGDTMELKENNIRGMFDELRGDLHAPLSVPRRPSFADLRKTEIGDYLRCLQVLVEL